MSVVALIVIGIIAGYMAKRVMLAEGVAGTLGDLVIGVIGALVGGWAFNYFGHPGVTGGNVYSVVVVFIGAFIFLWTVRLLTSSLAKT